MRHSETTKISIMRTVKNFQKRHANSGLQFSFFVLLIILLFNARQVRAQVPTELPAVNTGKVNAGSLLTQFASAIKPSSFTDQWASSGSNWLSSASKIVSAPGMIEAVTSLTKFIKPSMFKETFNPANLIETATKAKTMVDAASMLKSLNTGLKPEAMVSSWADKEGPWLSTLNLLK
jgi:hypothetical protein